MAHKIRVLLVEHNNNDHDEIKNMLEYFSCEVTTTKLASTAISTLSKGKGNFDMVMANMDSPDAHSFKLLQDAIKMDLFVILISDNNDTVTTMRALEQGALLCVKKPVMAETIIYLWQHVFRENVRKLEENQRFGEVFEYNNNEDRTELGYNQNYNKINAEGTCIIMSKKNKKCETSSSKGDSVTCKKKAWLDWNEELHQKFMDAVTQLGEGRCYPKEILELMDIPGLTRMQVASHLQKCRNANRLLPGHEIESEATPPKNKAPRTKTERFGTMPHVFNYSEFRTRTRKYNKHKNIHQEFAIIDPPTETNNSVHGNNVDEISQLNDEAFYKGQTFGLVNELLFGYNNDYNDINISSSDERDMTTFEFPNMDSMVQDLSAMHQELGMGYNGNFQSLVLDQAVNLNQAPTVSNATNDLWSKEITESVNDNEETEG